MLKKIALIPAYCPTQTLCTLVDELTTLGFECVVVNDGSAKSYDSIFQSIEPKVHLLHHSINKGKGATLKEGLDYIEKQFNNCVVVTVDADGQHKPIDVLKVAKQVEQNPKEVVLGIRTFHKEDVPFKSYYGNKITEYIFYLFTGQHIHDTQTGLRGFHHSLIPMMLEVPGDRYEYEMNQLLYCIKQQVPLKEIEIETVYENNNQGSHFHPFRDSFLIYKQILQFGLVSFSSFLVDFILFGIFTYFLHGPSNVLYATILARILSALFNYEVNRKMVFQDQSSRKQSLLKYSLLALVVLSMNLVIIYTLTTLLRMNPLLAKLITETILFLFSWFIQKKYVFTQKMDKVVN